MTGVRLYETIRQSDGNLMDLRPRCWRCKRQLAVALAHPWEIICPRCHATNCNMTESEGLTATITGAIVSGTGAIDTG